jgi:hypothetical protein
MITELSSPVREALDRDVDDGLTIANGLRESLLGPFLLQALEAANSEVVPVRRLKALYFAQAILARTVQLPVECATAAAKALEPFLRSDIPHERQSVSIIAGLISRLFERAPLDSGGEELNGSARALLRNLRALRYGSEAASR